MEYEDFIITNHYLYDISTCDYVLKNQSLHSEVKEVKKPKIIFTYLARISFVNKDIDILNREYDVVEFRFDTDQRSKIPFNYIKQFLFLLRHIWTSHYIVAFFAGYHTVLLIIFGKLFRKKVVFFLGGAEGHCFPEFGYGHQNKRLIGCLTCFSVKHADLLLPVDESIIYSHSDYYHRDKTQGLKHYCKGFNTPYTVIPLEYDATMFQAKDVERDPYGFIVVGFGIEGTSFMRKGVDLVIEAARALPDMNFTVLGVRKEEVTFDYPANVTLMPPVPYEELPYYYSRNRFYLQLSIAEGFPSAICEAMLCECVPIGSNIAAIPEIIGNCGFLLQERDPQKLVELIQETVKRTDLRALGKDARNRIRQNFGLGSRALKITHIFKTML